MPRAGLSTDAVVEVALALVDEKGVEALSLAAVADRAGVAAPSLYKHVGSLADLRDLMAVRIMRQLTDRFAGDIMGRSGDDAVATLMRSYRAYVLAHPGRLPGDPLAELAGIGFAGFEAWTTWHDEADTARVVAARQSASLPTVMAVLVRSYPAATWSNMPLTRAGSFRLAVAVPAAPRTRGRQADRLQVQAADR